jgi:pimeloyl-ACP methyl ester carboxylesterase
MKTVLFVPGFHEDIKSRDYKSTIDAIKSMGYSVKFIPINWKRTVIDDWVKQLEHQYDACDAKDTILAGFSYGSLTAFMAASKRNPAELWLCSFSPYFADDIPKMKKSWLKGIGKRRTAAFSQMNFDQLASSIRCKTLILYGEKEAKKYPLIGNRAEIAHKVIKDSTLIKVPNADHDVTDLNYIASLKEAI